MYGSVGRGEAVRVKVYSSSESQLPYQQARDLKGVDDIFIWEDSKSEMDAEDGTGSGKKHSTSSSTTGKLEPVMGGWVRAKAGQCSRVRALTAQGNHGQSVFQEVGSGPTDGRCPLAVLFLMEGRKGNTLEKRLPVTE